MNILDRLLAFFGRGSGKHHRERPAASIDFGELQQALEYRIHHKPLFSEALAHRSYLQISNDESVLSNERLEFLGDAVLNLVIAEFLFQTRTDAHEGDLTKIRSRLVNRKALSVYARDMQLGNFILMSPSTAQMEGKGMDTILADAFEAIIGAIYLDGGFLQAKRFIERHVSRALQKGVVRIEDENFKSQLLERTQSQGLGTPRYMTVSQDGPDHDRTFTIEVVVGNVAYGKGVGKNKKDAEQAAAEQTLQMLPEPPHNED